MNDNYAEGYLAGRNGVHANANPHPPYFATHYEWEAGRREGALDEDIDLSCEGRDDFMFDLFLIVFVLMVFCFGIAGVLKVLVWLSDFIYG